MIYDFRNTEKRQRTRAAARKFGKQDVGKLINYALKSYPEDICEDIIKAYMNQPDALRSSYGNTNSETQEKLLELNKQIVKKDHEIEETQA